MTQLPQNCRNANGTAGADGTAGTSEIIGEIRAIRVIGALRPLTAKKSPVSLPYDRGGLVGWLNK